MLCARSWRISSASTTARAIARSSGRSERSCLRPVIIGALVARPIRAELNLPPHLARHGTLQLHSPLPPRLPGDAHRHAGGAVRVGDFRRAGASAGGVDAQLVIVTTDD